MLTIREKLNRSVDHIHKTVYIQLILGPGDMVWRIDASFAVHMDMRIHTGSALTPGLGLPISGLHKQKYNATSINVSKLHGI